MLAVSFSFTRKKTMLHKNSGMNEVVTKSKSDMYMYL